MEFLPYPSPSEKDVWALDKPWAYQKTARHHVDADYTGCTETPMLDSILESQGMPADVIEILYALMGRTMFPLGTHDNFDIMPFFLGVASTGKSTILKVLLKLFSNSKIGSITETFEGKFGLESKCHMDILEAQDVPPNMGAVLNQQMFQKMVCGERLSVAKKSKTAEDMEWSVPMVMCGNIFLSYKDEGGCISRRVVVFEFKKVIANPDAGLLKRILAQELPNIAARFLSSYFNLVAAHKDAVFWNFCPEYLKRTREVVRQETSFVARFLAAT